MAESLEAIMKLLRREELVTMKTDWFELRDAHLQLASWSDPHLPVYVAASFTPAGPMAADGGRGQGARGGARLRAACRASRRLHQARPSWS